MVKKKKKRQRVFETPSLLRNINQISTDIKRQAIQFTDLRSGIEIIDDDEQRRRKTARLARIRRRKGTSVT